MRQHLYRGLTFGKRERVYGYYALIEGQGFIIHSDSRYLCQGDAYRIEGMTEVDPATVCESTGKRDSKRTQEFPEGQEIYEGDIVRLKHGTHGQWREDLIITCHGYGFFARQSEFIILGYSLDEADIIEVVATIHDAPVEIEK